MVRRQGRRQLFWTGTVLFTVLSLILSFPECAHGACAESSCARIPGTSTSVVLNLSNTHDRPYACRGEEMTFSCVVTNAASLQWASEPGIPCNVPIGYTTGDDEGESRTRDSYKSHLTSVIPHSLNPYLRSTLTFTPPGSVNSVTVHCGDQLALCSTEDEYTVHITDAPQVTERSLKHYFMNNQESCPNVSVTIEIEEVQGEGPLTYKLNVSSSVGCALQECPMLVSPGERIVNMTLTNGVNYTAMLTVSNDCGTGSTTISMHPVCEPRATDPPPPETPTHAATTDGAVVSAAIGGAVVGAVAGAISVAVIIYIYSYRKKKKKDLERRSHHREQVKMKAEHEKELEVKMKAEHEKELRTLKRSRRRRLILLQDVSETSPALSGSTEYPLHMAAKKGNLEKVKQLVDEGADINIKDNNERTPLHVAVERALTEIAKYLVDSGADITIKDDNGMTPFHVAAKRGRCKEILRYLIAKGGDTSINIKDEDGTTPLHVAVREGQENTVKFLVKSGADLTIKDNRGMTPFHAAAERGRCEKVLGLLIAKGGDTCINIKDEDGRTPLHVAVEEGEECTVESLVENFKADINNKDSDGMTPLHVAVERGDRINILKYLLKKGAEIDITDDYGWTPIHIAAKEGHEYSVRTLVKKGADISIKDDSEMTPRDLADDRGHENIKTFLEEESSPEKIGEYPRNINMMDGMKVWKEGDDIRMTVYEDNETMYDLQGRFEAVGGKIVGLHLHSS